MVICLFKHGGAALTRSLFAQEGNEVVLQRITQRTLLQLLEKVAVRMAQRFAAKSFLRWLPMLGALGAGAYSYYDTSQVATNAIALFSREMRMEPPAPGPEPTVKPARRRAQAKPRAKRGTDAPPTPDKPTRRRRRKSPD
jgi:hypothetical protein